MGSEQEADDGQKTGKQNDGQRTEMWARWVLQRSSAVMIVVLLLDDGLRGRRGLQQTLLL